MILPFCTATELALPSSGSGAVITLAVAKTLVNLTISVIAHTREVVIPAAIVHGIARDHNFPVFLECYPCCVTAANADVR